MDRKRRRIPDHRQVDRIAATAWIAALIVFIADSVGLSFEDLFIAAVIVGVTASLCCAIKEEGTS